MLIKNLKIISIEHPYIAHVFMANSFQVSSNMHHISSSDRRNNKIQLFFHRFGIFSCAGGDWFYFYSLNCIPSHQKQGETNNKEIYEPHFEKTGLPGFRPGPTQTGLYSHRR